MVRRILRHAAAYHVFREPEIGFVEHTAASKMLATSPPMRQWVLMMAEELWPAASKASPRGAMRTSHLLIDIKRRSTL